MKVMPTYNLKTSIKQVQHFKLFFKISTCAFLIGYMHNSYSQCGPPTAVHCKGIPESELIRSTPGNVDFTFDNFSKYNGGITISGATLLRLKVLANDSLCKWALRMYIDNNGGSTPANEWELTSPYSISGAKPTVDLIQVKLYNGCNTPINSGTYQQFTPAHGSYIDIINNITINPAGSCSTNVNGAGTYLTNYNEFSFTIDYRIVPGLTNAAGMYQLQIKFCLIEE
jgi:hypothetical protein